MAGSVGVPTPWWQIPGAIGRSPADALANLQASAPAGYQYDPVAMNYVPVVGSATDALAQRARQQSIEDKLLGLSGSSTFGATTGTAGSSTSGGGTATVPYPSASAPPEVSFPGMGTAAPGGSLATGTALPTAQIAVPDTSAAMAAVFNRAKDQVGRTTTGSLTALRSALAARGLLGGGVEGRATANVLTAGAGQLADTTREQAIQEGNRQNDFAKLGYQGAIEQRGQDITTSEGAANRALDAAKTAYQGGITQRGQDIDTAGTRYSGAITQRGQDIAANTAANAQGVARLGALSTLLTKLY